MDFLVTLPPTTESVSARKKAITKNNQVRINRNSQSISRRMFIIII